MKKIIFLFLGLYAVSLYAQPYMLDQIVAIVGSKHIKQSDVEGMYLQYRLQGVPVRGDMKCSIFEELLTQKLMMNQAEVDSLVVEGSEVEQELNRRLEFFIRQTGSQEKMEEYFKKSIYEIKDDLRSALYDQLLAQKMQGEILKDVKVTPSEVRSFYNKIPKDSIPLINGQVEVAQLVMYPPYSDEAISEVRQELLNMRKEIINGRSFRTLAVLYSEEPAAVRTGGEIGFQSKGEGLDPEYVKAAWALKNKGDVSRIVETQFGYHIIQLIDKRGDQVNTRHIIKKPKLNPEAIETVTQRLDSVAKLIKEEKIDWDKAVLYFSQDENTRFNGGVMINPNDFSTSFEMNHLEKSDYEVIKNLKIGEISAPFESKDEKQRPVYKILKVNSLTDPHRANLKEDYTYLQSITQQNKSMSVIEDWVNEKIESSYIYIDDSFKRCGLNNNNWLK
ncbi:MAG: peptidylprolyl isomerase [Bacteroidales bacterium]|jgi:peptidyl-prolyl cis-trans isomerase SurA|nr:peptidylprolyl isomerase [Bacteroidales bacterium]